MCIVNGVIMKMDIDNIILEKFIRGEASLEERKLIVSWIEKSEENRAHFFACKARYVFENLPDKVASDQNYNEFKRRVKPNIFRKEIIYRVAALLLIPLTVFSVIQYFSLSAKLNDKSSIRTSELFVPEQIQTQLKYYVNPGVKGFVVLPDGSEVWLNSCSELKSSAVFDSTYRMVELSGEGYFKITPNSEWPFYVKTSKGITVKVTGTEFNLSSYENDSEFKFTLVSGAVTLIRESTRQIIDVSTNEEITIPDDIKLKGRSAIADIALNTSWKDGYLMFDNCPMGEVIKKIERWYGVTVSVADNEILKYNFTANFQSESITQVLELLNITSNIGYNTNKNNVTLFQK